MDSAYGAAVATARTLMETRRQRCGASYCALVRVLLDIPRTVLNTRASQREPVTMDWIFYLTVLGVLFFAISALLAIRYLFNLRLERLEKKQQKEVEARQTAESNSGL